MAWLGMAWKFPAMLCFRRTSTLYFHTSFTYIFSLGHTRAKYMFYRPEKYHYKSLSYSSGPAFILHLFC
jgi:hypothetical protein